MKYMNKASILAGGLKVLLTLHTVATISIIFSLAGLEHFCETFIKTFVFVTFL